MTLGCGKYDIYVKTRGGTAFSKRVQDFSTANWGRKLNDISEAAVTISMKGDKSAECCSLIRTIKPWKHELSFYRDGTEVWCGPIVGGEIDMSAGTARFDARDLFAWFDKRFVEVASTDQEFEEADITEVFAWLVEHGYIKGPFGLDWESTGKLNIPIDRTYPAYLPPDDRWGGLYPYVGEELRALSDSGVDYTVVNRALVFGNLKNSGEEGLRLTEKHWITLPKIRIIGTQMSNDTAVAGGGGGSQGWYDDQMWIERDADSKEEFGLLQYFESVPDLDDVDTTAEPNAITERAKRTHDLRKVPYEYLTGGSLSTDAPVTFGELIPGRRVRIDLNQACRETQDHYLLTGTKATLSGANDAESVELELVPLGADLLSAGL